MAKQLLLNALAKVLGEFIDINEENLNLSLAVWSGQIVLNNLKLKTDSFVRPFNLTIFHGTINRLEINIPWTALLNSPVQIIIDGVNLQLEPLNLAAMDKEETKKRLLQNKLEKLKLAEKFFESSLSEQDDDGKGKATETKSGSNSGNKNPGYLQQMTTKIIDNLEVTLKNVHVRYQDSHSIPGTTFAAGITLSSFILATCDDQWRETYVARSASQPSQAMHKIAKLHGLGIYWNANTVSFSDADVDVWSHRMQSQIYSSDSHADNSHLSHLEYILAPRNNLSIKMTHNNDFLNSTKPKFSFVVESTSLPLAVDRRQLNQLSIALEALSTMQRRRQPFTYRPLGRPTDPGNARVWWRYACKLIIKRPRYLRLVRLSRLIDEVTGKDNLLTPNELEEMKELEQRIPLHALIIFRHIAAKESAAMRIKQAKLKQLAQEQTIRDVDATANGGKSWWGWVGGEGVKNASSSGIGKGVGDDSNDVPIASILEKLGSDGSSTSEQQTKEGQTSNVLFELMLQSSSTIDLYSFGKPIIKAAMAIKVVASVSGLGISTQADLTDILVEDKCTPTPIIKNIISVQHFKRRGLSPAGGMAVGSATTAGATASSLTSKPTVSGTTGSAKVITSPKPILSVVFETNHGKSTVKITALPIVFSLNKLCIQEILTFIYPTAKPANSQSPNSMLIDDSNANAQAMMKAAANQAKKATPSTSIFEVFFEAHAPKIIVPETTSSDVGLLLLDTGYLSVKGSTSAAGMAWDVTLKEINAAMPLSVRDMHSFDEQLLYLIKPFDIVTKVQNIDKSIADMTVSVDITPEIRGELDSNKLARLLAIVQVISSTFSRPKPMLTPSESIASVSVSKVQALSTDHDANIPAIGSTTKTAQHATARATSSPISVPVLNVVVTSPSQSVRTDDDDASSAYATPKNHSPEEESLISAFAALPSIKTSSPLKYDLDYRELQRLIDSVQLPGTKQSSEEEAVDPSRQGMFVSIKLPAAVLDLLYDTKGGHHVVFELIDMDATFVSRLYDMRITFDMSSISIQDSMRSENQRYLVRTPKGSRLVHIDYASIQDIRSPLYKQHATDIIVNFSHLDLDCDVNTIAHLKPFIEVLLAKKPPTDGSGSPTPNSSSGVNLDMRNPNENGISGQGSFNQNALVRAIEAVGSPGLMSSGSQEEGRPSVTPTGLHIILNLDRVSMNLLRPSSSNTAGAQLDMAYSLQVSRLIADINMRELLYSNVTLHSFEILDSREVSRDYVYRTIFCSVFKTDHQPTTHFERHDALNAEQALGPQEEAPDLLHIVYQQETKNLTLIKINVCNTTSFVAIDTILDFVGVFFGNFFAILDLLASKPAVTPQQGPPVAIPVSNPSSYVSFDGDSLTYVDSNTMNLSVKVENPKLIILDDPSVESSRSFVGRCGVEVHYTREVKTFLLPTGNPRLLIEDGSNKELHESLHVSIRSLELSVQREIDSSNLQSLLEPLGIEFHLRRRSFLNGFSFYNHLSVDIDSVHARVSLGDIMLAQSILTRRLLVDKETTKTINAARASSGEGSQGPSSTSPSNRPDWLQLPEDNPSLSIAVHSGIVSLTAVNDHNGQNVPLLKMVLEGSTFSADGFLDGKFLGEGSLVAAADIYNSKLSVWEPFLEKWKPTLIINAMFGAKAPSLSCELKADHTLQLTLSGMMIEKMLEVASLFSELSTQGDVLPFYSRDAVPEITLHNLLGDEIHLAIRECGSGNLLMTLPGGSSQAVPKITNISGHKTWIQRSHMPSAVDLEFQSGFGGLRKPIHHLPFNIHGTRMYNIQCDMKAAAAVAGSNQNTLSQIALEPIVEELYENARYDPITGRWRQPFLLGDPRQYADASETQFKDGLDSVQLVNADRWEWQGDWTVDMQGIIGEEIDEDGWEYSTNFSSFSVASRRRCALTMDCVRRRRWIRIRRPKATAINDQLRPYTLFWDVSVLKNGSRQVFIRSGLQIQNNMPFPIDICLAYSSWSHDRIFGPIAVGELFSIPLTCSYATSMLIRPAGGDSSIVYKWSASIPCSIQQYDFKSSKDITCVVQHLSSVSKFNIPTFSQASSTTSPLKQEDENQTTAQSIAEAAFVHDGENTICIRVLSKQSKKCLVMTLVPYVMITNAMPCELRFRCLSGDRRKELGTLAGGATSKLSFINLASAPRLSLKVGKYGWSKNVLLQIPDGQAGGLPITYSVEIPFAPNSSISNPSAMVKASNRELSISSDVGLVVSMIVMQEEGSMLHVKIFSKWMLADRSGLNFSIWSQYKAGSALIKHTMGNGDEIKWDEIVGKNGSIMASRKRNNSIASSTLDPASSTESSALVKGPIAVSKMLRKVPIDPSLTLKAFGGGRSNSIKASVSNRDRGEDEIYVNQIIYDLMVDSPHDYKLGRLETGQRVYTDRSTQWTHVPTSIQGAIYVRTAAADRMSRSKHLIQFQLNSPAIVFIFVDIRIQSTPRWILDDGYNLIIEKAIARKLQDGELHEFQYSIFGKYFDIQSIEDVVVLKGNWNKNLGSMYAVAILPDPQFQISKLSPVVSGQVIPAVVSKSVPSGNSNGNLIATASTRSVVAATPQSLATIRLVKDFQALVRQIMFVHTYDKSAADRCWIDGGQHLVLFHSFDDTVALGLGQGRIWSDDISLNPTSQPKGFFEIVDWNTMKEYQLCYTITSLPGLFGHTQILTVMPKYAIVNCIDEPIFISQKGCVDKVVPSASTNYSTGNYLVVEPYHSENWHKFDNRLGNMIHIRTQTTEWSLACIDINEVGNSIMHLPRQAITATALGDANNLDPSTPYVIHVEVKEADPSEHCSVVIIIWRATVEGSTALSIHNDTNVPVAIAQADVNFDAYDVDPALYEICISPGQWIPFGWADPDASTDVMIAVGTSLSGSKKRIATIDLMQKTGELLRLPDNSGRAGPMGEVLLSLVAREGGRVLRLTRMSQPPQQQPMNDGDATLVNMNIDVGSAVDEPAKSAMNLFVACNLASVGISMVLDKPIRREFLSLYADGLQVSFNKENNMKSIEFKLMDVQVDNYSETFIYPVMIHSTKKEIHKSVTSTGDYEDEAGDDDGEADGEVWRDISEDSKKMGDPNDDGKIQEVPLLQVTIIQEISRETASSVYPYIAVRMLPLAVEVDSATLQLLYNDLLSDLKFISSSQVQAVVEPTDWIDEFNKKLFSPREQLQHVDVYRAQMVTQASKMYFEKLVVHPIKLVLTFVQVPYPRKEGPDTIRSTVANALTSLAAVEKMKIKLKSFDVENAMETKSSLLNHIAKKSLQDLQSQLAQIAGSLAVLGSPMGFARKVGSGVKAFFYEPYQGAVHSPHEFIIGIGKGTSSLISGVVTGAMNSTVAFVGTASKGISYLSGDSEYVRKRAMKRQRNRANGGGIMDGIINGGESIVSGLTSGVSGLLTKPFEEAGKTGALGFIRGIGLGLIGAAVKPVMGITDGITSVATGISNSVGEAVVHKHVRPSRALDRSPFDNSELVINPLNLDAAFAQDFILRRAKANSYQDAFLSYIPMGAIEANAASNRSGSDSADPGEAIILSEVYVYWRKSRSLWGRTWANISHCVFMKDTVGLMLYAGAGVASNGKPNNRPEAISIPCGSRSRALRVYTALAQNADRMGNPSLVVPVDLLDQQTVQSMGYDATLMNSQGVVVKHGRAVSLAGELDGYRFGSINGKKFPQITGPENDVLRRAEHYLTMRYSSLAALDESVWKLIWEWECTHMGLQATRCCGTVIINRSDIPIQIGRVQIVHGCNICIYGSSDTNYEVDSRCIQPMGSVVIFIWAFSPSPIEIGHLKANVNTVAFDATVASTQRESSLVARGGFSVGFLEKTVSEWWSKYVILIE